MNLSATSSNDDGLAGGDAEMPIASAISNLTHDLANPLNAIAISTELAKRMLARGQSAEAIRALATVNAECDRCTRLLRDAQDYFSLEMTEHSADVDLQELLDDTVRRHAERGVIEWRKSPRPHLVRGNPDALCRLFHELLRNAFDHGAQRVELSVERESRELRVRVGDDGPGIDPAALPRIFEPFYSTTRQRQSGIGLAVAQRIARAHGGEIGVEEAQRGAAFRVTLPAT